MPNKEVQTGEFTKDAGTQTETKQEYRGIIGHNYVKVEPPEEDDVSMDELPPLWDPTHERIEPGTEQPPSISESMDLPHRKIS